MGAIGFDEHHLLTISFEDSLYSKEYSLTFSGCKILSKDKGILVYNKRRWRVLHLKEVSEGMQVCYLKKNFINGLKFNVSMIENALALFQGFNEETGEIYHYLPFYSKNIELLERDFNGLFGLQLKITKEPQGNFIRGISYKYKFPEEVDDILCFIYALILIYGTFDEKNGEVFSVKAHIPLVGGIHIDEELDDVLNFLAKEYGIFINSQRIQNGNKTIYQFASNDRELLKLYVGWMNYYRKNMGLKLDNYIEKQHEIKVQLLDYIRNEEQLNINGKDEVLELLERNEVKFLKCF